MTAILSQFSATTAMLWVIRSMVFFSILVNFFDAK